MNVFSSSFKIITYYHTALAALHQNSHHYIPEGLESTETLLPCIISEGSQR